MLYLLMDAGPDTYALATASVVKVVPCAALKAAPGAPPAVVGILNFRGQPVPVLDCSLLLTGQPCPLCYSSRIILQTIHIDGRERMLGLLGENLTRVQSFEEGDFIEPGARAAEFPGAGRVAAHGDQWIQRLHPHALLTAEVWETLTTQEI
ncbi:MAG: chemotaxis protein CheW [Verrucomicrobia bacterium]|nr:chemotaxis protein CheW [Verrucomicrobiota bacterium]